MNWLGIYISEGIGRPDTFDYKPKKSYLAFNQINQVVIYVIYNSPENTKEIREYIKDRFDVTYCDESVRQLLIKRGLKVLRPETIPGSPPSVGEQRQFIRQYNDLRNKPDTKVLFGDAMHLIHQNLSCLCWGDPALPPVFGTNPGSRRLNILGAYNPVTHSLIHHTGEENCNTDRVSQLFDIIVHYYPNAPEIHLITDNAKYFHAGKVSEWLRNNKKANIHYLPPYALNPNLIERLWGFVKKTVAGNKYY